MAADHIEWTEWHPAIEVTGVWSDALGQYVTIAQQESKELHECRIEVTFTKQEPA